MNQEDIKVGGLVLVTDGSYAVRVDSFEGFTSIGLCHDAFEVIKKQTVGCIRSDDLAFHDIFIKNTVSGKIYLHSSSLVREKVACVCRCCKCCNK